MEEDIKILEELCNEIIKKDDCNLFETLSPLEIALKLENLLKRYKELEEELESEKFYHNADKEFIQKYHDEASELNTKCINLETQLSNSIPISVIQNKIDFYKKNFNMVGATSKINVLQELLDLRSDT